MIRILLPVAQLIGRVGLAVLDRRYPLDAPSTPPKSHRGRWDR